MLEEINLLQGIVSGGPALILAIGIAVIWRTWRADSKQKGEELAAAREALSENQEKRVEEAQCWSKKYNEVTSNVKTMLESFGEYMKTVERLSQGGQHGPPSA